MDELLSSLGASPSDATAPQSGGNGIPDVLASQLDALTQAVGAVKDKQDSMILAQQQAALQKEWDAFVASHPGLDESAFTNALYDQVKEFMQHGLSQEEAAETVSKLYGNTYAWNKLYEQLQSKTAPTEPDATVADDVASNPNGVVIAPSGFLANAMKPKSKA